jgi:hypothetical protein
LILPFDFAQGGELVEPFRISDFEIRILYSIERYPPHPYGVLPQSHALGMVSLFGMKGRVYDHFALPVAEIMHYNRPLCALRYARSF